MNPTPDLAPLRRFITSLDRLLDSGANEPRIVEQGGALLRDLVSRDDWLPDAFAQPDPERYQQFQLYVDPRQRFSIVSFVWGPGQATPVHDHTVWGLIGMLRGSERAQAYAQDAAGRWVPRGEAVLLQPGQVEAVSPTLGDVHRVTNAVPDAVSISIHVYGADIGKVERSVYREDGERKGFVSGYTNPAPLKLWDTPAGVRAALLAGEEIALLDVREEDPYAQAHPLWAANLPLARIELDAGSRIPRLGTRIVVYDDGEGLADAAVLRLQRLGYVDVSLLEGGLDGWRRAGGELFRDVNVPSKAFGEWVEAERHTPSLSALEVKAMLDAKADVVVLDARRFDEYRTMSIPGAISVPGGELALRVRALAPNPKTRVIVNCAGRTRSIIGTQSLVNAGIPNPVAALRNGTIGWTLAGQALDHGASRRFVEVDEAQRRVAASAAQALAERAGAGRASLADLQRWCAEAGRTTYLFDVRTPEEFEAGHLAGARSVPGGQLVQETDHVAPVRGARLVLADDDGVRASMTASWLAQLGWEVHVLEASSAASFSETGPWKGKAAEPAATVRWVTVQQLSSWLEASPSQTLVIDVTTSASFVQRHIPGAWWALRSQLASAVQALPAAERIVLTCGTSALARHAAADLAVDPAFSDREVFVLQGGNAAWVAAERPVESGDARLASPRIDRYRRPYEGTDNAQEAVQAYLDWEYGLVEQLRRDGTHGFEVI